MWVSRRMMAEWWRGEWDAQTWVLIRDSLEGKAGSTLGPGLDPSDLDLCPSS